MKRSLYLRLSGKRISSTSYRILFFILLGIPLLLVIYGCFLVDNIVECSLGILLVSISISVFLLASNRMIYSFDGTDFLIMNSMGCVKKRIRLAEIVSLVVVGAANDYGAVSKELGFVDPDGRFIYYPYLLLYKSHVTIKREGNDARSYKEQEYGFTIIQENIRIFHAILNNTSCPIYFDERIIQDHYNIYEFCQNEFGKGRVKKLNEDKK